MTHRSGANKQKSKDLETTSADNESAGPQDSRFFEVVERLLDSQQREKEEQQARWEQREEELRREKQQREEELRREKQEERVRWEEQQETLRRDKEEERRRADEEWALRLEELKLRTEALRRSEEIAVQSRAENAERDEKRRLQKRAEKLEPWRDTDLPEAYIRKFERTMREASIPQKEWSSRLISLLTGKALTAFHNNVPQAVMDSYSDLKEALMEALGLSLEQCRRTFWSFTRKPGETPQEAVRRVETIYDRMVHKCETDKDYRWEMLAGRYLSTYSAEVADYVRIREPKTTIDMANLVQQYFDGKRTWRDRQQFQSRPFERGNNSGLRGDRERGDPAQANGGKQDASGVGIGAVLSVERDKEELPVGFFSKKLSPSEQKYSATELECLAVVKAIDHFAVYLWGRPFTVVTDHRALQYLDSSRHLNSRLTRWALQLQQHSFKIKYRPGVTHGNADGLSRQAWKESVEAHLPRTSGSEGGEDVRVQHNTADSRQPLGCP